MRAAKNNKNIELISLHRRLYICFRFLRKQKPIPSKELLSAVLKSRLKDFFPGTWHARNTPRWVIFSVCAGNSFAQTTNLCCLQGTILRWKNLMNNIFPLRWEGNLRTIVIGFDGEDLQWSGRILLGDKKTPPWPSSFAPIPLYFRLVENLPRKGSLRDATKTGNNKIYAYLTSGNTMLGKWLVLLLLHRCFLNDMLWAFWCLANKPSFKWHQVFATRI